MKPYLLVVWDDIEPELQGPFSTEEERFEKAKRIRRDTSDHGVYMINAEGPVTVDAFSALDTDDDMVDGKPVIGCTVHSDDHVVTTVFDAEPYFRTAHDDTIDTLFTAHLTNDSSVDDVVMSAADTNSDLRDLFKYLELRNRAGRESIGYSANIDREDALKWLAENRPELHARILDEYGE